MTTEVRNGSRRVLVVVGPAEGGMARHVTALTDHLLGAGWAVTLAGPTVDRLGVAAAVEVVPLPFSRRDPVSLWRARARLRVLARSADLIHAHGLTAGWLAHIARWPAASVPFVVTLHNVVLRDGAGALTGPLRALEGALVGRADAVIAVSDVVARNLRGSAHGSRVQVLEPPVAVPQPRRDPGEVRRELGVGDATTRLAVVLARLHPQKGLPELLTAVEQLPAALRGALRLVVAGDGPARAELEAQIRARGLGGTVDLLGARDDAADLLGAADLVVSSARWESVGFASLEALALGRPLVATAVGVLPEVVTSPEGAWLVEPCDVMGLRAALEAALGDAATAAEVGAKGRTAWQFWQSQHAGWGPLLDLYEAVLG